MNTCLKDYVSLWVEESLMVSYSLANFGSHRHCGGMFLVTEGPDSTCPHLNTSLLFISKAECMPSSQNDFGYTNLQKQLTEIN